MERQKKVLDASVILKAFTNEIDSNKVINILEDFQDGKNEIIVPEFIFLEITNALRYKKQSQESLNKTNKELWNLGLKIESLNPFLLEKAIEISLKNNITIYDAIYVSLAQINGCQLVTSDKELYKIPNVIPLEKS